MNNSPNVQEMKLPVSNLRPFFFTQAQLFQHLTILEKDLSDDSAMLLEPHSYSFFFHLIIAWLLGDIQEDI